MIKSPFLLFLFILGASISLIGCQGKNPDIAALTKLKTPTQDEQDTQLVRSGMGFVEVKNAELIGSTSSYRMKVLSKEKGNTTYTSEMLESLPTRLSWDLTEADKITLQLSFESEGQSLWHLDRKSNSSKVLNFGFANTSFQIMSKCSIDDCKTLYIAIASVPMFPQKLNDTKVLSAPPLRIHLDGEKLNQVYTLNTSQHSIGFNTKEISRFYYLEHLNEFSEDQWIALRRN